MSGVAVTVTARSPSIWVTVLGASTGRTSPRRGPGRPGPEVGDVGLFLGQVLLLVAERLLLVAQSPSARRPICSCSSVSSSCSARWSADSSACSTAASSCSASWSTWPRTVDAGVELASCELADLLARHCERPAGRPTLGLVDRDRRRAPAVGRRWGSGGGGARSRRSCARRASARRSRASVRRLAELGQLLGLRLRGLVRLLLAGRLLPVTERPACRDRFLPVLRASLGEIVAGPRQVVLLLLQRVGGLVDRLLLLQLADRQLERRDLGGAGLAGALRPDHDLAALARQHDRSDLGAAEASAIAWPTSAWVKPSAAALVLVDLDLEHRALVGQVAAHVGQARRGRQHGLAPGRWPSAGVRVVAGDRDRDVVAGAGLTDCRR